MKKQKDPNALGFKTYFGTTTMGALEAMTAALMQSFFMLYLTDYSGLGSWAASLGSALLVFARVFDAVNDPLEAWIMDRAKPGKYGKYKPFVYLSIILQTIGVACLFFIPGFENKFAVAVWVIVFYLCYDMGYSFFVPELIYRSVTLDDSKRGKLMIGPRMMGMAMGMIMSSLIAIVASVNVHFNNYHTAFGVTVTAVLVACAIVAFTGISMVKETYVAQPDEQENAKITDFIGILKKNRAARTRITATVFSGFIYTCLFATCNYYVKWGYCADLTTGNVDTAAYGLFSLVTSMMMFTPIIIGTVIAIPLMKKLGGALQLQRFDLMVQAISCGMLVVLQFTGILQKSPIPFFACMAVCCIAMGADFIPVGMLNMEVMDYELYLSGKDRSATVNAMGRLLSKAQNAVATAAVGVLLTAVGYVVDSVTDTYLGDLAAIPSLLNWFIVVMGLIPCIFGLTAWFILGKYPITDEIRADMKKKLGRE